MPFMRAFVLTAPWWKLSLLTGIPFALLFGGAMMFVLPGDNGLIAGVGVFTGVAFGLVMGPVLARMHARARAVIGPMSTEQYGEVLRASQRGPVPADPEIRHAATRLARWRLDETVRQRTGLLVLAAVFLALFVVNAIVVSPIGWLLVALWVAIPVANLWGQKRLQQRVALLEGQDVGA